MVTISDFPSLVCITNDNGVWIEKVEEKFDISKEEEKERMVIVVMAMVNKGDGKNT